MVNLYQSEVGKLGDEELRVLSEELSEEYCCNGEDESYWTDDAAEIRYYQLRNEMRRRWEIANPELAVVQAKYTGAFMAALADSVLESLKKNLAFAGAASLEFEEKPRKIGEGLAVRMPVRFHE